jgi:periplasmic divalent cation tolerance protein
MEELIQVTTTAESKEEALKIAREVVAQRLAACAQVVGPISSVYWWEGSLQEASEWLCTMKTVRILFEPLRDAIKKLQTYSVPEIVATGVCEADSEYAKWVKEETKKPQSNRP